MDSNNKSNAAPSTTPARRPWYAQQLSSDESGELMTQISLLTERGLPLVAGLRALAEEDAAPRLRGAFLSLAAQLESGRTFAEALDQSEVPIPPADRALLVAAVRSGDFAEVIEQYMEGRIRARDLTRRMIHTMIYPAILLAFSVLLLIVIEHTVVASFRLVYQDFDAELPAVTMALLAISDGITYFFLGGLTALAVVWVFLLVGASAAFRRRLAYRLTLVGRMWQMGTLAQFARLAGLLVRHATPLPDALHLSAAASGDPDLRRTVAQITPALLAGKSLGARLAAESRLPAGLAQAVTWGEDRHALADSLQLASEMFEGRAQSQFTFASVVGPPLALAALVFVFGFVVISLMMPMIGLIEKLA